MGHPTTRRGALGALCATLVILSAGGVAVGRDSAKEGKRDSRDPRTAQAPHAPPALRPVAISQIPPGSVFAARRGGQESVSFRVGSSGVVTVEYVVLQRCVNPGRRRERPMVGALTLTPEQFGLALPVAGRFTGTHQVSLEGWTPADELAVRVRARATVGGRECAGETLFAARHARLPTRSRAATRGGAS